MGLGGPNLVKGATGQVIDSESLGGARMHTTVSGVAHYLAKDDADCLDRIRQRFRQLPAAAATRGAGTPPARDAAELRGVLPADHRLPYEMEDVLLRIFDAADYIEFQPEYAPEMLCANARLEGRPVASDRQPPRFSERSGRAAHRRHHLYGVGAEGGVLRGDRRTSRHSAGLSAGCLGLHGRTRCRSARASSARAPRWWKR